MYTYNVLGVVVLHLLDVAVDQGLVVSALHLEFLLALEARRRKEDEFDQCDDTVLLDDSWGSLCLADFLGDNLGRVEEIDLAICSRFYINRCPCRRDD